jgi:glycosyltransferase involved in cell wall biosynthesis
MADVVSDLRDTGLPPGPVGAVRLRMSRRRIRGLIRQGRAAANRRDWGEAAGFYRRVVQANPSLHAVQVQLGHAYKELGEFDRAGRSYHAALRLIPADADLHIQVGHLEKLKGNPREAAAYYARAAELNPENTDAPVEYYALALKLGLPPLPSFPAAAPQGLTKTHQQGRQQLPAAVPAPVHREPTADIRLPHDRPEAEQNPDTAEDTDQEFPDSGPRPKVLFVSDSLGTPIHARGIFHYSIALVEILRDMGFEITLIVQKSPGYGLERGTINDIKKLSPAALDSYQLGEIHRYFNDNLFSFEWDQKNRYLQIMVNRWPAIVRASQRVCEVILKRYEFLVNTPPNRIDIISAKGGHLRKFDRFRYIDRFYATAMSRAGNDLDPVGISAAGYDLVIMDTPHYVRVKNIHCSRIFTVVHDLIPLSDAYYEQRWRWAFLGKMRATLAGRGNLIFVSEYSRSLFHVLFPKHKSRRQIVVYPSIPKYWMERAVPAKARARSTYLSTIARDRVGQRREQIRARAARLTDDPDARADLIKQLDASLPSWNGSLPYFTTVTSDEPRKNIGVFCKIAPEFVGRANFVVVGQVNGNGYMNYEPEMYSNLHFTGYLDDDRKVEVIRHSAGMIFPSVAEGFGIPIVEGALFGIPVICSNLSVFHEITSNMALYFEPGRPDELANRINEVLSNPTLYAEATRQLRDSVVRRFSQESMQQRLQQALSGIGVRLPAVSTIPTKASASSDN